MQEAAVATRSLVLASGSPRRQELLRRIGLTFGVRVPGIEEVRLPGEEPTVLVERLAREKALAVASELVVEGERAEGTLVIGADTCVVLDGEVLGKPADEEEAFTMLSRLSGRTHRVLTGVAVVEVHLPSEPFRQVVDHEETGVTFRPLAPEEIRRYIASGEPMDKAGAYGVQGLGSVIVTRVDGCFFNVVGLPLPRLAGLLKEFGVEVL